MEKRDKRVRAFVLKKLDIQKNLNMNKPIMHCHNELIEDIKHDGILPDTILFKWFNDKYSTSKHLLILYSIAKGLDAKKMLEIGFGRSTFVLARAAYENEGELISCDNRDFSYLLSEKEKSIVNFILGNSNKIWGSESLNGGVDFAFLDYFSSIEIKEKFCFNEIRNCLSLMKTNGIIAVHDSLKDRYSLIKALKKFKNKKEVEIISLPFNYGLALIRYVGKSKFGIIKDDFIKKAEI